MTREPLGFLSGTFKASQQRWATVDNEGFAMVSTFKWLEYLCTMVCISMLTTGVWRTFSTRGLRVVRCEEDGAGFGPVEGGIGAV